MQQLEWLAKTGVTGRLTTFRDVLYFIFDVNSQASTFSYTQCRCSRNRNGYSSTTYQGRTVLDRHAAYRGDCTAWESADRATEMSQALDPSDIQRPS